MEEELKARIKALEEQLYAQAFQLGRIRGALDDFDRVAVNAKLPGSQRVYNTYYKRLKDEIKKATD